MTRQLGLHLDFETRSAVDLRAAGAFRYAEDPTTDAWCCCYAQGDEEVQVWLPDQPFPDAMRRHAEAGGTFVAHNYQFEWAIWTRIMGPRHGWPLVPLRQWDCTAIRCAALALPRALDKAAAVLRLEERKDISGKNLMMKMSRPVKDSDPIVWHNPPGALARLIEYCKQDVVVEREIDKIVRPLSKDERRVMMLDALVNDRGFRVDLPAVEAALGILGTTEEWLNMELKEITGGKVAKISALGDLIKWLAQRGVLTKSVDKEAVDKLLDDKDLSGEVRRALEIKKEANYSSTKKLVAMKTAACKDERVRGSMVFLGAPSTGRFSSSLVQVQNLPRGSGLVEDIDQAFPAIMSGCPDTVDLILGPPHRAISDCIRGFIVPAPGKVLVSCDYAAIEAKITAVEAGQDDMIQVFLRDEDIYKYTAAQIYNIPSKDVNKNQRQVGKVACIAEGEPVLTDRGLVPIQNVQLHHKVWDGEEWVKHDGVVERGVQEVICHDGLTATPDHTVFTKDGRNLQHGRCAREQIHLATTGLGRQAIRYGGSHSSGNTVDRHNGQKRVSVSPSSYLCEMHGLQHDEMDKPGQSIKGQDSRVSELFSDDPPIIWMVEKPYGCGERSMYEPEEPSVSIIRWSWNPLPVQLGTRSGSVCYLSSGLPYTTDTGIADRSRGYEWSLRAFQYPIRYAAGKCEQPSYNVLHELQRNTHTGIGSHSYNINCRSDLSLRAPYVEQSHSFGVNDRRNNRSVSQSKKLQTKRVYDIINAGPRHRFTVSGKLVHNCLALGYAGGVGAFTSMARVYRVDMGPAFPTVWEAASADNRERSLDTWEESSRKGWNGELSREQFLASDLVKRGWRDKNSAIRQFWYNCEEAAMQATSMPGRKFPVRNVTFLCLGAYLYCQLASGRVIVYPNPKIEIVTTRWDTKKEAMTYVGPSRKNRNLWGRQSSYGGLICENISQGTASSVLRDGLLNLERAGYPVVFHVHDEAVVEIEPDRADKVLIERLMTKPSPWMDKAGWPRGLITAKADGPLARYRK